MIIFRKFIKKIPLELKFFYLILMGFILFPFFIHENMLVDYSIFLLILTILLSCLNVILTGFRAYRTMLVLWFAGLLFYSLIALPLLYSNSPLTYSMTLHTFHDRVLYLSLYPLRVLNVFLSGMIFVNSLSPTEFLKYGKTGYYIGFFLRSVQVAGESLQSNVKALQMSGKICEKNYFSRFISTVQNSSLILTLSIRNMMIWLFWSSNHFEKIKKRNLK